MPNTYTQLYIQIVFAVQNRAALIHEPIREEIQKYLTGIVKNNIKCWLSFVCRIMHMYLSDLTQINRFQAWPMILNLIRPDGLIAKSYVAIILIGKTGMVHFPTIKACYPPYAIT